MASKTIACCLVFSLFVFLEVAASEETCDAYIDLTVLIHATAEQTWDDYSDQKQLCFKLIDRLLPSQNDVRMRFRFYNKKFYEYYSGYGGYEDINRLKSTMSLPNQPKIEFGNDVIHALSVASRLDPETSCRRRRGARRIVLALADAVDKAHYTPNPTVFRNMMEERGVDVLALAVGNSSTLGLLDNYLDLNGSDRIIKLDNFTQLLNQDVIDEVVDELCKVTPQMTSYRNGLSASFRAKFTHKGHAYYLSSEEFDNLTQVYETCSSADGYLAVINDQQEYDAMKQYFTDNDPGYVGIYIDGTDAHTEGIWTLLSGAPLPFVDWLNACRPDRPHMNCLVWATKSHQMFDSWCNRDGHPNYRYLFLCEVPDTCEEKWR